MALIWILCSSNKRSCAAAKKARVSPIFSISSSRLFFDMFPVILCTSHFSCSLFFYYTPPTPLSQHQNFCHTQILFTRTSATVCDISYIAARHGRTHPPKNNRLQSVATSSPNKQAAYTPLYVLSRPAPPPTTPHPLSDTYPLHTCPIPHLRPPRKLYPPLPLSPFTPSPCLLNLSPPIKHIPHPRPPPKKLSQKPKRLRVTHPHTPPHHTFSIPPYIPIPPPILKPTTYITTHIFTHM